VKGKRGPERERSGNKHVLVVYIRPKIVKVNNAHFMGECAGSAQSVGGAGRLDELTFIDFQSSNLRLGFGGAGFALPLSGRGLFW
jgi:hypothetical protein